MFIASCSLGRRWGRESALFSVENNLQFFFNFCKQRRCYNDYDKKCCFLMLVSKLMSLLFMMKLLGFIVSVH